MRFAKVCKHGREKCQTCRKYCIHGKRKTRCIRCGGSEICEHKRLRSHCIKCDGSQICEHKKRRSDCSDCGGSQICEHKKRRSDCADCGGSQICEHKRLRSQCIDCGGSKICEHKRLRWQCKECLNSDAMIHSGKWCIACLSTRLSPARIRAGVKICAQCDPTVPDRIEKVALPMFVAAIGFPPSAADDTIIGGTACDTDRRRPDTCWITPKRIAILETDESGHVDRLPSCEIAKVIDQTISVQQAYPGAIVAHFRFNPLEFDNRRVSLDDRVARVANDVRLFLNAQDAYPWRAEVPYVLYYYYPQKAYFHIDSAMLAGDALRVLTVSHEAFTHAQSTQAVIDSWNFVT